MQKFIIIWSHTSLRELIEIKSPCIIHAKIDGNIIHFAALGMHYWTA